MKQKYRNKVKERKRERERDQEREIERLIDRKRERRRRGCIGYVSVLPAANPTTSEFTTTMPAL
jgi:hypothetical protein